MQRRPNRYQDQAEEAEKERAANASRIGGFAQSNSPSSAPAETAQDRKNEKDSDFWRFVGDVAPAAGGVIGGIGGGIVGGLATGGAGIIPGAGLGATVGTGLGGMGGQAADSYADSLTAGREDELAEYDDEEQNKADRKQALLATLMSLRR